MKNILLCGLKYENNFGDTIIFNCVKKMYEDVLKENKMKYKIDELDLNGRIDFNKKYYLKKEITYYLRHFISLLIFKLKYIFKKIKLNAVYNYLDGIRWELSDEKIIYKKEYTNKIKSADLIVFVGGGIIKYKYQEFYNCIDFITKCADKYDKKIYFNAVGVEGFDLNNYKCRLLRKALNRNCVKMITTRDDLETLKKYISNDNIICKKVSDPAVYTNEIYKINKNEKSNIIGLCVCRDNLFQDNDVNYSKKQLLNLWKEIIEELERKNIKWKIYTNGNPYDNKFAHELLKYLEIKESKEALELPQNDTELINTISMFKGVIATRLHSCIISYSLNIPAIGLVWNDKLKFFGKAINYSERFIEYKDFSGKYIVKKICKSINEEYNETDRNYKSSVKEEIKFSINEFIKRGEA